MAMMTAAIRFLSMRITSSEKIVSEVRGLRRHYQVHYYIICVKRKEIKHEKPEAVDRGFFSCNQRKEV